MRQLVRAMTAASVVASIMLVTAFAAAAAAGGAKTAVHSANITGAFSAAVVQGAGPGTSYKGTLRLAGSTGGLLSGTLETAGKSIAVTGQVHGQLIGLTFTIAPGKTISGTGIVGYDPTTKTNTIGGTFAGPGARSIGVWSYLLPAVNNTGGCVLGIPTGACCCYVIS
jgi:hypothetical protein